MDKTESGTVSGAPIEHPQIERIINGLGVCVENLADAVRRLHDRIDRLDGGVPEGAEKQDIKPSRNGQLGILEDGADALRDLLAGLHREITRLERL